MADYHMEDLVYELNCSAAQLARAAADKYEAKDPAKPRFVAGTLGPTNRTASISPDVNDPGFRNINFDQLVETYTEAVRGLIDGGADILMVETIFDTLNDESGIVRDRSVFRNARREAADHDFRHHYLMLLAARCRARRRKRSGIRCAMPSR